MRLFFALWPEGAAAASLRAWAEKARAATGGVATRAERIHVTLAFLGDVDPARMADAIAAAREVRADAHEIVLSEARYWPHNRIVWAGPASVPPATAALAAQLRDRLRERGFALEKRDFVVHVTLLRKASLAPLPPFEPLRWPAGEFVLVCSRLAQGGSGYEIVERFGLAAA
jgi:2'-5' RNA ligase